MQKLKQKTLETVGPNNSYNLPKNEILERLKKINTTIYRTDQDGSIYLKSNGLENTINKLQVCLDGDSRD